LKGRVSRGTPQETKAFSGQPEGGSLDPERGNVDHALGATAHKTFPLKGRAWVGMGFAVQVSRCSLRFFQTVRSKACRSTPDPTAQRDGQTSKRAARRSCGVATFIAA